MYQFDSFRVERLYDGDMCEHQAGKHVALVIDPDQLHDSKLRSFIADLTELASTKVTLLYTRSTLGVYSRFKHRIFRFWMDLEDIVIRGKSAEVGAKNFEVEAATPLAEIPKCFLESRLGHLVLNLSVLEELDELNLGAPIISCEGISFGAEIIGSNGYNASVGRLDFTSGRLLQRNPSTKLEASFDFSLMTHKYISTNINALENTALFLLRQALEDERFLNLFIPFDTTDVYSTRSKLPALAFLKYFLNIICTKFWLILLKQIKFGFFWELRFNQSASLDGLHGDYFKYSAEGSNFVADPFIWTEGGKSFCFFEYFDSEKDLGRICAIDVSEGSAGNRIEVLEEPFHLSFPYIFSYGEDIYMCPETSAVNEIRIYKCEEFPSRWTFHKTIMKNVNAADSVLFPWGESWWLLTTLDLAGIGDHGTFLYAFNAPDPLSHEWTPHNGNPIIRNAQFARNAGLIVENGSVIRASQSQGFNAYGRGLRLSQIAELDLDNFKETADIDLSEIQRFAKFGLHHLDLKSGILVIDTLVRRSFKN